MTLIICLHLTCLTHQRLWFASLKFEQQFFSHTNICYVPYFRICDTVNEKWTNPARAIILCSFALELRAYATTRASNKWVVIDSKHKIFEREILHNIATIKHRLATINMVHIMLSMKTGDSVWRSSLRDALEW